MVAVTMGQRSSNSMSMLVSAVGDPDPTTSRAVLLFNTAKPGVALVSSVLLAGLQTGVNLDIRDSSSNNVYSIAVFLANP